MSNFIFILILVPVFVSMMFIPYLTRRTESFGVTIPEEVYHQPKLKGMRQKYALVIGIISAVIMAIYIFIGSSYETTETMFSILFSIVIFFYLIISFCIYLLFHRRMKAIKAKEKWMEQKKQQVLINSNFRSQKLTYSNLWFLIPFSLSLATILLTFRLYDQIPEQIPMQYNFNGEITNWADKSYRSVLILPIMQMYLTLLFIFINTLILKAKQQISAAKPEQSMKQNVIFRRRWSAFMIITSIGLVAIFSLIQLSYMYSINSQLLIMVPILFGVGVTISTVVISFATGQGGSRVLTGGERSEDIIDRDEDQYWKLGQFYFNRNDPSLFLEKRFGVGWTINLASPLAWSIFIVIILLAVGIPILLGT